MGEWQTLETLIINELCHWSQSGKVAILYLNRANCWEALIASSATT